MFLNSRLHNANNTRDRRTAGAARTPPEVLAQRIVPQTIGQSTSRVDSSRLEKGGGTAEPISSAVPEVDRACDGAFAGIGCRVTARTAYRRTASGDGRALARSSGQEQPPLPDRRAAYLEARKLISNNSLM
ncbi:hypothetical protein EVAR_47349_1 [Eumeta japonica]|uniref:Uncharacterized protein n=1 Tax=Eumeta variegata TaxID=151549 RepID=A0A4C1WUD0_EUMVA|nr:hypothetical protein EVAR_47349_1 [Eumeta japonica]